MAPTEEVARRIGAHFTQLAEERLLGRPMTTFSDGIEILRWMLTDDGRRAFSDAWAQETALTPAHKKVASIR